MYKYILLIITLMSVQLLFDSGHCFPSLNERWNNVGNLNSTSILSTIASIQSNATATGLGSTVEISGTVSGETSSSSGVETSSTDAGTSFVSSQVNCSEYSNSSASGASSANVLSYGDCILTMDETGSHQFQTQQAKNDAKLVTNHKAATGIEEQKNSQQNILVPHKKRTYRILLKGQPKHIK